MNFKYLLYYLLLQQRIDHILLQLRHVVVVVVVVVMSLRTRQTYYIQGFRFNYDSNHRESPKVFYVNTLNSINYSLTLI